MNNIDRVMRILFEEPIRVFHVRLLARLTKLNPNTIISITDKLAADGILLKHKNKDSGLTLIKSNIQNANYKLNKQFYNIKKIYGSGLVDFLNEKLAYPSIILFGSYAKAENRAGSDIDLFIVSEIKEKPDISIYEHKLNAEIQLFIYTQKNFRKLIRTNPELVNNFING